MVDTLESEQLQRLEVSLYYSTEWDEFWSFVQTKSNIRWMWYLFERRSGVIIAWQNGRRTDEVLQQLLQKAIHCQQQHRFQVLQFRVSACRVQPMK